MTITNGYATLTEFHNQQRVASSDSNDDDAIELLIEAASRFIDSMANTTFYKTTSDAYFDVPADPLGPILFDRNCTAVNTVTNGDASVIPSTAYYLLPANGLPKYGIGLKSGAGVSWRGSGSNGVQAIKINADWGDTTATPTDIKAACLAIAKAAYNRRFGDNVTSTTMVTQGGVFITPEDVPSSASEIIRAHRRNAIG